MGEAAKISPRIPSTYAQNAFLCLLIIHIIPSCQIYVDIDNSLLVPFVSCLATSSYLWHYVRAAVNVSHTEIMQCRWTAAGDFLTCTNCEMESKLPEFSGTVVSAWSGL